MLTIYDLFKCTAESFPDRPSVIHNDTIYTFREINRKVNALAHGLYKSGLRPHMTVGILMYNGVDFFCLFYALYKLGCVLMPLNWRLTSDDIADHILRSKCDALVYDNEWVETIAARKQKFGKDMLYFSNGDAEPCRLSDFYLSCDPEWEFSSGVLPDDPAQYLLTGGTSSNSKIAIATQEKMMMRVLLPRLYNTLNYTYKDNFLTFNPMFHQGGVGIFLPVSLAGGCITMIERMDVEKILQAVEKYRVTRLLLLPPSLCNRIKENPQLQGYDLSTVKYVMLSGGASSGDLANQVFEIFPNAMINTSYGATENAAETMHVYTREQFAENPEIALSIGKRSPFSHLKLLDEKGNEVSFNTPGECYGKSYGMFSGYLGRPDPFVDGYFPTGDYLSRDEKGYYYFHERKKFVIKSGGELVIPSEVEAALMKNPKVSKAAVFGLPDSDYGEKVAAAVVLKDGVECSSDELRQFVKQHIASYKKPQAVFFLDDLCYTSIGKVDKRKLQSICIEIENKNKEEKT